MLEIENSMQPEGKSGTGNQVGRTVVQSVVDAHRGSVEWSSPHAGVFLARVVLPLVAQAARAPDRHDASTHSTEEAAHGMRLIECSSGRAEFYASFTKVRGRDSDECRGWPAPLPGPANARRVESEAAPA